MKVDNNLGHMVHRLNRMYEDSDIEIQPRIGNRESEKHRGKKVTLDVTLSFSLDEHELMDAERILSKIRKVVEQNNGSG